MTEEEKDFKKANIIMEFAGVDARKLVSDMTALELYDLIKLAVNRKQNDL